MHFFQRVVDVAGAVLLALAGAALVLMMAVACANMIMGGLGRPIMGTVELVEFLGALVVAFSLAATQRKKGHIALTILAGVLPKAVERVIDILGSLACMALFGIIAWRFASKALDKLASGELAETLRFPYYPLILAVAFGVLVLALVLALDAAGYAFSGKGKGGKAS